MPLAACPPVAPHDASVKKLMRCGGFLGRPLTPESSSRLRGQMLNMAILVDTLLAGYSHAGIDLGSVELVASGVCHAIVVIDRLLLLAVDVARYAVISDRVSCFASGIGNGDGHGGQSVGSGDGTLSARRGATG